MSEAKIDPTLVAQHSQIYERLIRSMVMTDAVTFHEAHDRVRRQMESMAGTSPEARALIEGGLHEAWERIREEQERVEFYTKCALQSGRVSWYSEPTEGAEEWNKLVEHLRTIGRNEESIQMVDEESTAVLNLIDNPGQQKFSTRGLVVGYVQSGKTGNMAALLSKAAGTPFKFFVVLSGLTDTLRNQTQKRLDADILQLARPGRWHRETRADQVRQDGSIEKGDFTVPAGGAFQLLGETRHLAVMKKNAGVLRRLLRTLRSTPRALLEQTPFLIIDDECDQASVNSAAYDKAVTVINDLIRQVLAELPRVAYVGYTATPYANVLINTKAEDDLYPRHFIYAMSKAAGYFGAEDLFGRAALEGDASNEENEGYSMIRQVPPGEVAQLRPVGQAAGFEFQVAETLGSAIRYFILCIAAKEERGLGGEHASMLLHTSMLTVIHEQARRAVDPYLRELAARLAEHDGVLLRELEELWREETIAVSAAEFGLRAVSFEQLAPRLAHVAVSIVVKVENWLSTDRIVYDTPGRRYLVIGGNVLARGLTLEGLMVSLFMRTSSQYDTLMQMGRWFGYRRGFEDLPRIWMEDDIRISFFRLATVEEEIRRDVRNYAQHNVTPAEFAVRIRKIPGMMITNRNRLRHVLRAQVGFAGRHLQTIRFLRDHEWLAENWNAADRLLQHSVPIDKDLGIFETGLDEVLAFLAEYRVHSDNSGLALPLLVQYLRQASEKDGNLTKWHVAVVTTKGGNVSERPLGQMGHVHCNNRSAMQGGGQDIYIKALMSKRDLLLDLNPVPALPSDSSWEQIKAARSESAPPLLLLYPIDRMSKPQGSAKDRVPLDAEHDVLGVGVVLPGDSERSHDYITTNLSPLEAEEEPLDEVVRELLGE